MLKFSLNCCKDKSLRIFSKFLKSIGLSCATNKQKHFSETELGEKKFSNALKPIFHNKTPGYGGLREEIYEAFWNELKDVRLKLFY